MDRLQLTIFETYGIFFEILTLVKNTLTVDYKEM